MRQLSAIILMILRSEWRALLPGFVLAVAVLAMGLGLLALSGWFITASAAAGLVGMGVLFNVFAPSAMVRFLALARTAARYGERVLTHDATLRALTGLRVRLLQAMLGQPYRDLEKLRASATLNRVMADVDALDGALLRLVIPAFAGWAVILSGAAALWWLVHPLIAVTIGAGYLILPTTVFAIGQRLAQTPAKQSEEALQTARETLVDLIAGKDDLTVYGQIDKLAAQTRAGFDGYALGRRKLDGVERWTGAGLDLIGALITATTMGIGVTLAQNGAITAAQVAIGIFAALALSEAVAPVRRALTEIDRMTVAAARVLPPPAAPVAPCHAGQGLALTGITYGPLQDLSLTVKTGEIVALTGPSGVGKSTALLIAAGAITPDSGTVVRSDDLVMVPQRTALVYGTISENLRLADPAATDDDLWRALTAACIDQVIRERGGLALQLGFRGVGLSGGEMRRIALARAILRRPRVLLLDEPTEGLDRDTAANVLDNLRKTLPETAIIIAAHRQVEIDFADRVISFSRQTDTSRKNSHQPY